MTAHHQPSGLKHGLALFIDPNWSPDQALAVIELLDDLRDRIGAHYGRVLQQRLRDDRATLHRVDINDPPF